MDRGERLNNPGNVRISDIAWLGKVTPSRDPAFETFDTPEHGIRVIARILLTYFQKDNLNTIAGIIAKWAPASENDTAAYVQDVCDKTGYSANETLTPDADTLSDLVYGIIFHENGECVFSDDQIGAAVDDVLGPVGPATHNID